MILAIDGGQPVHRGTWPPWPPPADERQRALLKEVLDSGAWGSTAGPLCDRLAERFAGQHGAAHGVTVTNGTIALFIALQAAGVGAGDEVVVPAYTFVACATSVLLLGATPVIADVDAEHLHLSAETVEAALSERTRAIMVVHLAGSPAPMTEILELADRRGLVVIEDSAQAHGSLYRGHPVGALGTAATFSFQSSKAMTAGEGGLITTDDAELADRAWSLCNVGRERSGAWYGHARVGWNLRMTELQAALLLPWLDRLDEEIMTRDAFALRLKEMLGADGGAARVVRDPEGTTRNSRHLLILRLGDGRDRAWVAEALEAEGVPVDLGYPSLGSIPSIGERSRVVRTPRLDRVGDRLLWLRQPMMMAGADGAEIVGDALRRVLADRRSRNPASASPAAASGRGESGVGSAS